MKSFFTGLFMLAVATLSAQGSAIYGLARASGPAALYLAAMQPSTGVITAISGALPDTVFSINAGTTIDNVNGIFYYMPAANRIRGIDISTGNGAVNANMSLPPGHFIEQLQYNCADSTIYATYRTISPQEMKLCKVDPFTATITILSANSIAPGFSLNACSAIDPVSGIYYFYSNTLVGVSIATGNIVSSPQLTFPPNAQYMDMMTLNCNNGELFFIARNVSPPLLYMSRVNPVSGNVSLISSTPVPSAGSLNSGRVFNKQTNTFYTRGTGNTWLGISTFTGAPVSQPVMTFPLNTTFFEMAAIKSNCICDFNPIGIDEQQPVNSFTITPSLLTAGTPLTIRFNEPVKTKGTISVVNTIGQVLAGTVVAPNTSNAVVESVALPAGYYHLVYRSADGVSSQAFVVY
jgi:hypothetical protein